MVFDSRSEDPLFIVGSDSFLTVIGNALPQKSGNVIWFYDKDCCPDNHTVSNILFLQLMSEKVVSIHIEICSGQI